MMIKLFLSVIILFFYTNPKPVQQSDYREIYLFTVHLDDASFITQKTLLNDVSGLKERDLVVHEVVGWKANQAMFKKYKAAKNDFTFILLGKDGGEKLRSVKPVTLKKLYATIDAMPMRKDEMKRKP